ncbi:hypothetical protein SAMN05192571_102306 [Pleomorphomonas diazotrophica]|uniref:hypothetical protein n=1 Tax=Pleomorphomonas diazotrophica TaxID=1166257 RepID=UPI0008E759FD|nr:hypothetical protein [Pleomorphomonas diazotrophica]SFM56585.1 hypothetical protein SAMN05192571_102306 [Pleomorphomonas diazotrophica]
MTDRHGTEKDTTKRIRLSDHLASLALPIAVIAFGVALSAGSDGVRAFVDLCRSALP